MRNLALQLVPTLLLLPTLVPATAQQPASLRWPLAARDGAHPRSETGAMGTLEGQYAYVPGLGGEVLRFDGYTTELRVPAPALPPLQGGFTVTAWVALNTLPWADLPILDQQKAQQTGYALGVDALGHATVSASISGEWHTLRSTEVVPLKHWAQLATSCWPEGEQTHLALYLNGKRLEEGYWEGRFTPANTDLLVGRVREPELPFPQAEIRPSEAISFSLDGLLGPFTLTPGRLSEQALMELVASAHVPEKAVLSYTPMPAGEAKPGRFGAFYTGLHYEPAWDALRRVDDNSDVVVRFADSPTRLVFWQGLNYVPAWVSGDDKWSTDEFLEVWDAGCPDGGDCEPMSDKQARFSHVNIVESNDVRAVVHWRYALTEVIGNKGAWRNPRSGWTDWADEYWTVYPDGVAVRQQVLHSDHPEAVHEWQETIVLHQPGKRPEDDIAPDAITLGNMHGEYKTFSWTPRTDHLFANPDGPSGMAPMQDPNMQLVHTRSTAKPFAIVPPAGATADFYNNEKSYFTFECWNHWPVAQIASSDRPCAAPDRPSHTSLSHLFWQPSAQSLKSATKLLMSGLTDQTLQELLPLARSWLNPPALTVPDSSAVTAHYDAAQRAYRLKANPGAWPHNLHLQLAANPESPARGVAVLLEGWGEGDVAVSLGQSDSMTQRKVRTAHSAHLERTDLLLWLPVAADHPVDFSVSPSR